MFDKTEQEIMKNWQGDVSKPVVSVCTITYNHEKYIAEAIDSFLMQETDFSFEVVIGEDCSSDGTRNIIEQYRNKYPHIIKLIISENNVGMQKNGKRTLFACRGEYIALCEGDDYWIDKDKLQIQIDEMKKYSNINLSFHPVYNLVDGKVSTTFSNHSDSNKVFTASEIIVGLGDFCPTNSLIIKNSIIKKLPSWFYSAPVGDYFIQILGSIPNGALYINQIMSIYRVEADRSWSAMRKNNIKLSRLNALRLIRTLKNFNKYSYFEYNEAINQVFRICYYLIALRSLLLQDNNRFRIYIEYSYNGEEKKDVQHKLIYHLRKNILILKVLLKIKQLYKYLKLSSLKKEV